MIHTAHAIASHPMIRMKEKTCIISECLPKLYNKQLAQKDQDISP